MARIIRNANESGGGSTLPIIGRIKIGEKRKGVTQGGKEYEAPVSLDYFKCQDSCKYKNIFDTVFGDKPKTLKVVFISDDTDEVCNERLECWDKGKRYGYGDGVDFEVWDEKGGIKKDGAYASVIKTGEGKFSFKENPEQDATYLMKGKKWDTMLTLRFVLVEIPSIFGMWEFSTKASKVSIPSIVKTFDFVRERAKTICAIPFDFSIEFAKGYTPGAARNYPVIKLVPNISADSIDKVRAYLSQGNKLSNIATLMLTDSQLKSLPLPEALTIDIAHEEVAPALVVHSVEYDDQLIMVSDQLLTVKDAASLNIAMEMIMKIEFIDDAKKVAAGMVDKKAKELGLTFVKGEGYK